MNSYFEKVTKGVFTAMREIPVYPNCIGVSFLGRKYGITSPNWLPIYAPICEDDKGKISFLTEKEKTDYLCGLNAKGFRKEVNDNG